MIWTFSSRAARSAPDTTSRGAWSPPMASTAIFISEKAGGLNRSVLGYDFPAVVGSAVRAHRVRTLDLLALRAQVDRGIGELLVRASLVSPGFRSTSFRIGHRATPLSLSWIPARRRHFRPLWAGTCILRGFGFRRTGDTAPGSLRHIAIWT